MGLVQRSYKFISDIFQARLDSGSVVTHHRSSESFFKGKASKETASRAERTMMAICAVGEKRKRDDGDENFYGSKRRFVKGGIVEVDLEKEEKKTLTIRDDVDGDFQHVDAPRLPSSPCEFSTRDSVPLQKSHDERIEKVRITLENLTFINSDTQFLDNSPNTMHVEDHDDYIPEWESKSRGKRCHSESSIELPPHANAFTGSLPGDSGRMSAPPNLDATWSLTSHLAGCSSPGYVSTCSEGESLDLAFELAH
jgi:hypothetical protein